jgi:hypothetical protein
VDHIEAVKGYFPMTYWRRRTQKELHPEYDLGSDKSWIFLLVIALSVVALIGLLVL